MLTAIEIKNFKSAEKLNLDFGRVNVFIGENGSGKSNILEAITFAAAAESDKLDIEYLENRGIRVPSAKFMRSSFNEDTVDEPIEIKVTVGDDGSSRLYTINNTNDTYAQWQITTEAAFENESFLRVVSDYWSYNRKEDKDKDKFDEKMTQLNTLILEAITDEGSLAEVKRQLTVTSKLYPLKSFVIYSPQNKQLRNLTEEGSIRPVGIHGEGLFKLLREIHAKQPDALADIDAGLRLIGWYKSMDLDNEPELPEDELFIQDKYLSSAFTQRSANEGFLYVLFYMALIVSKDTPQIFAIDNIDAALNPKLCAKITSYLVELAKKYDKQLFLTTQNPATLDGIDLFDEAQKLFVVSRKRRGQTTVREFTADSMPKKDNGELVMLSEAMIRGYIGSNYD